MSLAYLLAFYVIAGTILALVSRKMGVKSLEDYYVGGRRLGRLLAFGTYAATTYSAFMMIGLVGLAYKTGVGALGFELLYLASTVYLLSTVGYELWRLSRARKWLSPSEMVGDLYDSPALSKAVAIAYIVAVVPYLSAQIQGIGVLLERSGLSYGMGVALASALILAWMSVGGMWSVATTDLFQAAWMLSGGLIYLSWLLSYAGRFGSAEICRVLEREGYLGLTSFWTPSVLVAYSVPWMFFAVTNPQVVSRLFVHRDERAYKDSLAYFGAFGLLYTLISVSIGLGARGLTLMGVLPELGREDVTPHLLGVMGSWASAFVAVSIVAAAVSTGNSIVLSVASSIQVDILRGTRGRAPPIALSVALQASLVSTASLIALAKAGYVLDLSVMTSVMLLPQAPLVIYGVVAAKKGLPRPKSGSLLAFASGFAFSLACSVWLGPRRAFLYSFCGLPVSLAVLALSSAILACSVALSRLEASRAPRG